MICRVLSKGIWSPYSGKKQVTFASGQVGYLHSLRERTNQQENQGNHFVGGHVFSLDVNFQDHLCLWPIAFWGELMIPGAKTVHAKLKSLHSTSRWKAFNSIRQKPLWNKAFGSFVMLTIWLDFRKKYFTVYFFLPAFLANMSGPMKALISWIWLFGWFDGFSFLWTIVRNVI